MVNKVVGYYNDDFDNALKLVEELDVEYRCQCLLVLCVKKWKRFC